MMNEIEILFFVLFFTLIYIGFKIYLIIQLFKTKSKVKELQEETSSLKVKLKKLQQDFFSKEAKQAVYAEQTENVFNGNKKTSGVKKEGLYAEDTVKAPETEKSKNSLFEENITQTKPKEKKDFPFSAFIRKQLSIESVVSKLGILLLLIGIGYVFKFAHERGFIGKLNIIITGCVIGAGLTGLGFFVERKKRKLLSRMLFGGSISVFYLTAYAAYARYGMLGDFSAFVFLSIITVFAYVLAMTINSVSVSVIGLTGSLFIPFIVGLEFFGITSFGLYAFAVSVLSMVIYFAKRWRILQFSSLLSLLSVLTWLLIKTKLSIYDARLFLGLVIILWLINLLPDFYFYLSGKENANGKIYSPAAAIINYGFSFFLGFKLSAYSPVPEASIYLLFTFFYSVLSYICLKKDKVKNLGYTYIAASIISAYAAILDLLKYNVQPVGVLGIALFLYWLWRKDNKHKLKIFVHVLFAAGYIMAANALFLDYKNLSPMLFCLQTCFYFIPMAASVFFQKNKPKKILQTFVFQIYVTAAVFTFIYIIIDTYDLSVFYNYNIMKGEILFIYPLTTVLLFAVYNFIHYKEKEWFYEKSFYAAPVIVFLLCTVLYKSYFYIFSVIIQFIIAGGLLALSFFKEQTANNRFAYRMGFYLIIMKVLLIEITAITSDFYWGLFLASSFVLILDTFYKTDFLPVKNTKQISKFIIIWIMLLYYPLLYLFKAKELTSFNTEAFILNGLNALIFIRIIQSYKVTRTLIFAAATAAFVFLSFTDIYLPVKNNGLLTIVWGFYSISAFIYFLIKKDRKLVYVSLLFIIIISAKLIFIDLRTIGIISKVITSTVLGSALLVLSYAVQPMMKKISGYEENS